LKRRCFCSLATFWLLASLAFSFSAKAGVGQPALPDSLPSSELTPGDVLPVTVKDLCVPGFAKKVRNVPVAVKRQVLALYGIQHPEPGEYEVDHLVSLELGGSNSIRNLWPESCRTTPWNARVKNRLENRLHQLVCEGKLDLATAQQEIASDWIAAYKKYFGRDLPSSAGNVAARHQTLTTPAVGDSPSQVWVNTRSGIYFRPGTRWYGNTKEGRYMTEAEAVRQGYRVAKR
jgi:hypothetical protein